MFKRELRELRDLDAHTRCTDGEIDVGRVRSIGDRGTRWAAKKPDEGITYECFIASHAVPYASIRALTSPFRGRVSGAQRSGATLASGPLQRLVRQQVHGNASTARNSPFPTGTTLVAN